MTGAAELVQQFTAGGHGAAGQAIFLRQMVNTLFALHEAARANKQARIAVAIAQSVRGDLAQLVAAMPPIPSS